MLAPTGTAQDSPAKLGSLGEAAEETDGPKCQGEARGQSRGQENQRAREDSEMGGSSRAGEGKGRRRLEEGRIRQEGWLRAGAGCRGAGKMDSWEVIMEWGSTKSWILVAGW